MLIKRSAFILWVLFCVVAVKADDSLTEAKRKVAANVLAQRIEAEAAKKVALEAGVKLGTWHRIGPFRDQKPLLNWMDNVASSYSYEFDVEKDAKSRQGFPLLDKQYPALNFPAKPDAVRLWTAHPQWIDGYYQELPRGPAPSAGETQYIYREIVAEKPVTVEIDLILRSPESDRRMGSLGMEHWRRTGRYVWWVNGREVLRWGGQSTDRDMPMGADVELRKGKNHFLAKITNNRHAYGFAFSIKGLHPALRHEHGFESRWQPLKVNPPTDLPHFREPAEIPEWFVKKETWEQSLAACGAHLPKIQQDKQLKSIWYVLESAFDSPQSRREISLARVLLKDSDRDLHNKSPEDIKLALASQFAKAAAELAESPDSFKPDGAPLRKLIEQATELTYYRDCLSELLDLKFHPEPMPGVEHAAIDGKGRIVPAMEKALEKYPTSPAGDRHNRRLANLQSVVEPLLAKMVASGEPMVDEVLSAAEQLDEMWGETVSELPPVLFLERPTYSYDSMMFTGSGSTPAYIRAFDPGSRSLRTVFEMPQPAHVINLSWDGQRVLIGGGGKIMTVDSDGKNFRELQTGQSPYEMPDGRICFFGDDVGQAPCKATGVRRLLYICDSDGKNRKVVSANLTIDTSPSVMNDGRVIFTRWDYGVNKNVFNRHALWTQNPDGTGMDLFFGNTVIDPRSFCRPRQIPGRPEVLCVFGPHHAHLTGLIGLVWNDSGKEAADGVGFRRITRDTASVGDRPGVTAYQDPYPLNEQLFLVSYGGRSDRKVGLYLQDRSGNKKCILETAGSLGAHSSQAFTPRPKPPIIPDRSQSPNWVADVDLFQRGLTDPDWSQKATMLVHDVYQGLEPEIKRGQVKYLAVMEQVAQSHGRGGAMGVGTIWYANRVVGLVPIEEDGSAHFEVPALRSLYFHVLDKDGRMLMTQGSDFHVMPGEVRSCVGCHEQRKGIDTPPDSARVPMAARKAPVRPQMPDWGTNGIIEYETVVQPVLDKYCIECHRGPNPKSNLNLTGDRTTVYNMSYMELTDRMLVHFTPGTGATHAQPSNDYDEQAPLSRGSLLSKITERVQDPTICGKEIPFEDQLKIFLWIDSNVPFYSHCRQRSPTVLEGKARGELADVHKRRCAGCHDQPDRPDTRSGLNKYHCAVHVGTHLPGQWGVARSGMRVRHLNLSNPEDSAALRAPLAKGAGGWDLCKAPDGKPVFENPDDPDYQKILAALKQVEHRDEPGVKELLDKGGQQHQ